MPRDRVLPLSRLADGVFDHLSGRRLTPAKAPGDIRVLLCVAGWARSRPRAVVDLIGELRDLQVDDVMVFDRETESLDLSVARLPSVAVILLEEGNWHEPFVFGFRTGLGVPAICVGRTLDSGAVRSLVEQGLDVRFNLPTASEILLAAGSPPPRSGQGP